MGGCRFGCEITADIVVEDRRESPPDNGMLLTVGDAGDNQRPVIEVEKCAPGVTPSLREADGDTDEDDADFDQW